MVAAAPPPLELPVARVTPQLQPVAMANVLPPPLPPPPPRQAPVDDLTPRLHAPAIVVDTAGAAGPAASPAAPAAAAPAPQESKAVAGPPGRAVPGGALGQFAAATMAAPSDVSVAGQLPHLDTTVLQGATIDALLETAINSDLPGYVRAIVKRDLRGFDGKAVLIPRGSRVIGQYRNAQSQGEARVFIIWSRLIRPDGVSVDLESPGGDALGRGGLTGEVDTHFFARFGDAIMLSVLSAGVGAVSGTPSTQIAVGSSAAVGAAAGALPRASDIPPTIKVAQGARVTIFVAHDLDFSHVKSLP
jgi:type IV secretion system protein VirB10